MKTYRGVRDPRTGRTTITVEEDGGVRPLFAMVEGKRLSLDWGSVGEPSYRLSLILLRDFVGNFNTPIDHHSFQQHFVRHLPHDGWMFTDMDIRKVLDDIKLTRNIERHDAKVTA